MGEAEKTGKKETKEKETVEELEEEKLEEASVEEVETEETEEKAEELEEEKTEAEKAPEEEPVEELKEVKEEEIEEEEVKKKKKEEAEEEIVEERIYTIPLSRAWISPPKKRTPRAMRIVRSFVQKHMKIKTEVEEDEEPEKLVLSNEVNEKIWNRGIKKPPRNIRVRVVKNKEGVVTVYLAEGD